MFHGETTERSGSPVLAVGRYRDVYEALSGRYDRDASATYFRSALSWILARLPPRGRVLDVGSGTGRYAVALADRGFDVVGVDCCPSMVRLAEARARDAPVEFRLADAATSGPEGPFEAVLFIDSWEFFPSPVQVMRRASAALAADGSLIIVTPHPAWRLPITFAERVGLKRLAPAYGYRNGKARTVREAAAASGLAVREMTTFYASLVRGAVLVPALQEDPGRVHGGTWPLATR